jgi:hypothetical protein
MTIVKLLGGLGNQMFQYALGRQLSIKNKEPLVLYLSDLLKRDSINYTLREFELDVFDIKYADKILPGELRSFKERFTFKYLTKKINENGHRFNPRVLDLKRNIYLNGYWQNEKYFKGIEDVIRQDFTLKANVLSDNESLIRKISSFNSVSVHFRLGDYLSDPVAKNFHGNLEWDYYKKAIVKITELLASPHFFIFSDDINWVKKNFAFEQEHTFVSHEGHAAADMHLMSLCKHNITANSSFSWWGAWLNKNPDKMVIAPQKWINNIQTEIIPERWVKI